MNEENKVSEEEDFDDFEIRNLSEEAERLLSFDIMKEWGADVVQDMAGQWKDGIPEFVEAFMRAVGTSVNANRLALMIDSASSVADMMVMTIATGKIGGLCEETTNAAVEKMKVLDDPLGVVMEIGDWLSTIMVHNTDEMRKAGKNIREASLHAILAGIWAVTSYLGHHWVMERDTARDECTLCAGKISDPDHSFLFVEEVSKKDGEGEDEKD